MLCPRRFNRNDLVPIYIATRDIFFFNIMASTYIYTLSLHDALPISVHRARRARSAAANGGRVPALRTPRAEPAPGAPRSEEHTSELQSRFDLVCRLLLEKKKDPSSPPSTACTSREFPAQSPSPNRH